MKQIIFLLILLYVPFVFAGEKATLSIGESYLLENRNITFVRADSRYDSAIFCVNGVKGIVSEDTARSINDAYIELIRLRSDSASIEVTYSCKKCVCGSECSNAACFTETIPDLNNDGEITEEEIILPDQEDTSLSEEDVVESVQQGTRGLV